MNDITIQPNMTLNEYATLAALTAVYPGRGTALGLCYCALKLNGEAGEVAENVGKAIRDDALMGVGNDELYVLQYKLKHDRLLKIRKEIGDCLWYLSQICAELSAQFGAEISLGEIAMENVLKLADRKDRNVLQGSGDDR